MNCPKCEGEMRSYERNGITVDQCGSCRGVFLDRGELEHLIDAEATYYERDDEPRRSEPKRDEPKRGEKPKKSKKRSFLENVLESIGE